MPFQNDFTDYLIKNTAIAQTNTKIAQPRLKYAVLRLVFHCVYVWQSRLTPIRGTQRLIACVHISNICRIANTITERATIMDTTVTILCVKGVSFHFVFIVYSAFLLPSLSKVLLRACILTGFVLTFSHHCFFTDTTVPTVFWSISTLHSIKNNRLFLALLILGELSDPNDKVEVNCFDSSVLFHEDCTVNKTLEFRHKQKDWRAGPPKTQHSYRTIPLTSFAYEILQTVYENSKNQKRSETLSQELDNGRAGQEQFL